MPPTKPQPHSALLEVTGWPTVTERGLRIGPVEVQTDWRPDHEQRMTVRGYPRTSGSGVLRYIEAPARLIKAATVPNGNRVSVTGHLLQIDRARELVRVEILPTRAGLRPFSLTFQASSAALAFDPATPHVRLTGRVLASGHLLAEDLQAVFAPAPVRWRRYRPKRGYGRHLKLPTTYTDSD